MGKRKIAIRDDDLCALTRWEEVEEVYGKLWGRVPISFSVIPFVGARLPFRGQPELEQPMPIHANQQVVQNLRSLVTKRWAEINLHGYHHTYLWRDGRYHAEYVWKPEQELRKHTVEAKRYLEALFGSPVRVFIPPSNAIGRAGISAVEEAGLNVSATMGRWGDRPFSISYLQSYLLRWGWRALLGVPYPYPLRVRRHLELTFYTLTPSACYERLRHLLGWCSRIRAPFVLAVHYWELYQDASLRGRLYDIVEEAIQKGFKPALLSECFDNG